MNKRERFLTAVNGGIPDRVPIFDFIEGKRIINEVLAKDIDSPDTEDVIECSVRLGFDAVVVEYGGFFNIESDGKTKIYKDEWGVSYKSNGVSWPIDAPISGPVKEEEDFEKWLKVIPDPNLDSRLDGIRTAIKITNKEIAILGGIIGPLTLGTLVMGFENLFIKMHTQPDLVEEVFKVSRDFYNIALDNLVEAGADVILVAEDLGFSTGLFMSPSLYRKHLFPYLFDHFHRARSKNVPVFLHADGNINEILDDLFDSGISVLHPIERKSDMDIGKIRKRYKNKLCLAGNIDASNTLVNGPADKIWEEVKETIKIAGKDGAYILASDSDYHDGIPPGNFIEMIKAAKEFGRYPINF
jgi:uroporphyrinogen decarboxylase